MEMDKCDVDKRLQDAIEEQLKLPSATMKIPIEALDIHTRTNCILKNAINVFADKIKKGSVEDKTFSNLIETVRHKYLKNLAELIKIMKSKNQGGNFISEDWFSKTAPDLFSSSNISPEDKEFYKKELVNGGVIAAPASAPASAPARRKWLFNGGSKKTKRSKKSKKSKKIKTKRVKSLFFY